jgi:hypothetical protein
MQVKLKKQIINIIYKKKINNLKSFAILFNSNEINSNKLTRISRTSFLKLNETIFTDKTLPANIYFYNYNNLTDLLKVKNNIILVKHNSSYFYPNQLEFLTLNNNMCKITNLLGFYKKFYFILKTISCKN